MSSDESDLSIDINQIKQKLIEGEEDDFQIDPSNPYEKFRSKNEKKLVQNQDIQYYEETSEERFKRFQLEILIPAANEPDLTPKY